MARDLQVNILAPSQAFEAGVKRMEASARALHASELRLIAAEERLENLRKTGKATAGQLASAQASVISAQDNVAKAHTRTAISAEAGQKRTSSAFDKIGKSATSMRTGVGLAAAAGGAAMVAMTKDVTDAASSLNEQMSAVKTIFKDAADEVIAFSAEAADIGLSARAALQASAAFGDLFTKLGYTHDAAAIFSEDLVRISADFASFKDLNPDEVLDKLRSGLAGESEPLRALGVFLTEAKVKAEAMRRGLTDAHGELDDGAKVAARYSLIIAGMGEAYGDVERTAISYANTERRAAAEAENLKATLGQQLLPIMGDAAYVFAELTGALSGTADATGDATAGLDILERKLGRTEEHAVYGKSGFELLADAVRFFKGESDDAAGSSEYAADSLETLADSQARVRQNAELSTKAMEEQAEALDRLLQATISQFDAELAYQQAVSGLTDDLDEYNAALAANADAQDDNNVSAKELADQQLGLQGALLDTAGAAVKQAEEQAAAAGKVLTESEKYDLFKQALLDLKEQFPQLAGAVDAYVARLDEVPPQKATTVILITAAAEEALARWERRFANEHTARYNITASVSGPAGDGPGRGGPALARIRASLPDGLRVTSTYRTPERNRAVGGSPTSYHLDRSNPAVDIGGPTHLLDAYHRTLKGMGGWRELLWRTSGHYDHIHAAAQGGHISGPGTGTSDSIPALLSNGEYVIRAASAAKIGRSTLDRLNRYATGGHVGPDRSGRPVGDPNYGADRGWGPDLLAAVMGLTDVDEINAAIKAWENYNEHVAENARLQELLADEAKARAAVAAAKTVEEEAEAHRDLNAAMQATTDFEMGRRRDTERRAVDQLVDSLEAEAAAREKVAEAARTAAEWAADLARDTQAAQDQALQELNRLLDQEQALRARDAELVKLHGTAVAEVQARQVQAEADYYTRRAALGRDFNAEQQRILDARRDSLVAWAPLDQVASPAWGNTVEQLVGNAGDQLRQFERWMAELANARGRGVSEEVIASLGLDEGPQALGQLEQFGRATVAEIEALNAAVAQRTALAAEQVSQEQQHQYGELGRALIESRARYIDELGALEEAYRVTQQELVDQIAALNEQLMVDQAQVAADLAAIGQEQGRSFGAALAAGLDSQLPAVLAAAAALQAAAASATAAAAQAADYGSRPGAPGKAVAGAPPLGTAGSFTLHGKQVHVNEGGIIDTPGSWYGMYPAQVQSTSTVRPETATSPFKGLLGGRVARRTYDSGGWLEPGYTLAYNGTGQREQVVSPQQAAQPSLVINVNGPVFGVDDLQAQIRMGTESALAQLKGAARAHGGH